MWPDRVSNPRPMTYESGALATVLRGPSMIIINISLEQVCFFWFSSPDHVRVTDKT